MHLFELLYERQTLRSRADLVPLEDREQTRLAGLERMLRGEREREDRRHMPRLPCRLWVQLSTARGGMTSGRLRNVSADGMALVSELPANAGDEVLVHIEFETGLGFRFPTRVAWVQRGELGVAFDGVPIRMDQESTGVRTRGPTPKRRRQDAGG